jgi:SPP1 gp7 family putative phage head morphogenesis protein
MRSIPVDLILHELAARLAELPDTQHRDLHRAISSGCIRPQSIAEEWISGAGVAQQAAWLVRRLDGEDMTTPRLREIAAETRAMEVAIARRLAEHVVKRRGSVLSTALDAVAANVGTASKAAWARQAKAAVGVDLSAIEPNLTPTMERFRRENLDLIVSMARDKVARVRAILDDAPNARVETIRDRILEEQGVTKRQAALIARDQVLSLNAQVAQARHEAAGITQYVWRTSGDGDVRPDHKALNGKVFSYDEPPVVNASEVRRGRAERREHPGQDYQCRCTAEPVIPGFDETPPARA